jgi:hypothetical protein
MTSKEFKDFGFIGYDGKTANCLFKSNSIAINLIDEGNDFRNRFLCCQFMGVWIFHRVYMPSNPIIQINAIDAFIFIQ